MDVVCADKSILSHLLQLKVKLSDDVKYDKLTVFDEKGRLPDDVLQSPEKTAIGIQCMYFTVWANYGALSIGLLVDRLQCSFPVQHIFSHDIHVDSHCWIKMEESWRLLYENTNLTAEESALLVGNCLGNIYKVGIVIIWWDVWWHKAGKTHYIL